MPLPLQGGGENLFLFIILGEHNVTQKAGPIIDCSGVLSKNLDETLTNWSEYYKKLYFCNDPLDIFPTLGDDTILRRDLELFQFLGETYSLKPHKSPGHDGLTSEDFRSLVPLESPKNELDTKAKLASLKYIFNQGLPWPGVYPGGASRPGCP